MSEEKKVPESIFRRVTNWKDLRFYQKAEVLYQLTYDFCERFLPHYGDRTVDQMIQAARSGKQNIVEGTEDGKTSTAMELNLLNVARSSIGELRQDYDDFLKSRKLAMWTPADARFQAMQEFTKNNNLLEQYSPYFSKWSAEEMANVALTLCYQVDVMMNKYMAHLERRFVEEGGVKERMHKVRTAYRQQQDDRLKELEENNLALKQQLEAAQQNAEQWRTAYDDLRARALAAYNAQREEIERLKRQLEGK